MLLPSTIACDAASQRLQSALASPPMSPLSSTSPASTVSDIIATSRSLHAILASTPTLEHKSSLASTQVHTAVLAPSPMLSPAVSPTFAHAPAPLKLHLHNSSHQSQRYAVRNPTPPPTASASTFSTSIITPKRKRTATLDLAESPMPPMASHSSVKRRRIDSGLDASSLSPAFSLPTLKPCTPKRARTCPEVMPLGLSRSDFDDVWGLEHEQKQEPCSPAVSLMSVASSSASSVFDSISTASTYDASNSDTEDWTDEDDDALIDIVLKKLRLSRQEWHECARTLGRNRSTISQRWKSLLMGGEIGLKRAHPASCR
ncbi:DNA-binding protein [Ceratocystis lukuohia]|uniref:DNA-binding protein n=1 Tax=Ceratocystis lukuohia TaxID=2019550 RepID=A0ABR4MEN9_9PEZI